MNHSIDGNNFVHPYIPSPLTIKARQIEDWAGGNIEARTLLPVLLRKLIHSTCSNLRDVDFPGYDNGQRKGNDGYVVSEIQTPWIPEGKSYWEFGVTQNPKSKAESDYNERLKTISPEERADSTFVFVTPRNWNKVKEWEREKNKAGDWKAVKALDASNLEQWIEQSFQARVWLAEQLALPVNGFETLDWAWQNWTSVCSPPLTSEIFTPSIEKYQEGIRSWLEKPSDQPYVISADSKEEAMAFLASVLSEANLQKFKDMTLIISSSHVFRSLISSAVPFIPIVYSSEVERELGAAYQQMHCIIIRPRNSVVSTIDVNIELLTYKSFEKALTSIGFDSAEIDLLARESGRSPTILRRRLSKNEAIRKPWWVNADIAKILVPMMLIGTWNESLDSDRSVMSTLANREYELVEDDIARLLLLDDSPIWSVGKHRGVVSKVDALFAISGFVTSAELDRFFVIAEHVLSESDPSLDLPEDQRWAAALYDKSRKHSSSLRKGICETLVLISVHGNNLFQNRIGIDIESRVAVLIRGLLTPLTTERLMSQEDELPRYAEAAPDEFIQIIEEDLRNDDSIIYELLKPVESSMFGVSPSRTGLLWALECLAWKPQNLLRVSFILAKLSGVKINDNWVNKPINSLKAIFKSWMPQTAATVEQRIKVYQKLSDSFPDIGWQIGMDQLELGRQVASSTYRPLWRADASAVGHVLTIKEMYNFNRAALDQLIAWPKHDEKSLGDLIQSFQILDMEDQIKIWSRVEMWSKSADDYAKAELRECIRQYAFTRSELNRGFGELVYGYARGAYDMLRPNELAIRHGWLFTNQWVEESRDEIENEDLDFKKRDERVNKLRLDAINEILIEQGIKGLDKVVLRSNATAIIGQCAFHCIIEENQKVEFIQYCLAKEDKLQRKWEMCLHGFISSNGSTHLNKILESVSSGLSFDKLKRLFLCAPFKGSTWELLDKYDKEIRTSYWQEVAPVWARYTIPEINELIDCLLAVKRPRAAFFAVRLVLNEIDTNRLKRLLYDIATADTEATDHYILEPYYISKAFNSLDSLPDITQHEMAQLEFLFINILDRSEHGIPNLEVRISESPQLFVQLLVYAFRRQDGGDDPAEWKVEDLDKRSGIAQAAYRLLNRISMIPGTNEFGGIDTSSLSEWIKETRGLCGEFGRDVIGDQCIGGLLSKAPAGENGIWPCKEVCDVMDEITSPEIAKGFYIGVKNARGFQWRGLGGDQERELAEKYRKWANALHFEYPFVAALLENIAKSYESEAKSYDADSEISKRMLIE